jgi:site-specific recombinase XerD
MLDFPQNNHFVESWEVAVAKVSALKGSEETPPRAVLRKVPTRPKNLEVRSREHLLPDEVSALIKAASNLGRHRLRDHVLILTAFRHGTGYYLANKGVPTRTIQAYLGHKSIQHTVRYTELSDKAYKGLWV